MFAVQYRMSLTGLSKDFGEPGTAKWYSREAFYGYLTFMTGTRRAEREFEDTGACTFVVHHDEGVTRYRYEKPS